MSHTTFHGKSGRFSSVGSAHSVTKGGERFKVVRQHRRMKPKNPGKTSVNQSKRKLTKETLARMVAAQGRGSLIDHLGRSYVSIKELLDG